MNEKIINEHIDLYLKRIKGSVGIDDFEERNKRKEYYQSFTENEIINMSREEFYDYIGKLWAMLMWGNKRFKIDQIIEDNGFEELKRKIAYLLYGAGTLTTRWDGFKEGIKGFGPAMMSELLCHVHPNDCMLWNKTALSAYRLFEVEGLPNHNYQMTGQKYIELTEIAKTINELFKKRGYGDTDLLFVDYFFWDQLMGVSLTSENDKKGKTDTVINNKTYHNEIIDYIKAIGTLLGYDPIKGNIGNSGKVADAVWEFNVGNIGRIKYVFEVQDSGSIDSLIVSLMNASQDTSVQAVVAVSDSEQIDKIKQHCNRIQSGFNNKLKFWDIKEVEQAYDALSSSMEIINRAINTDTIEMQL